MFGLERDTEQVDFSYDLEKDLSDPKKSKIIHDDVKKRISEIKGILHKGENEKLFDKYGILLHGYSSLKRVMECCLNK